jgi:beta-fructofuranosidase
LRIEPAPELEILRCNPRKFENLRLVADSELPISNVSGDCLEMALEIESEDAHEFGVKVRCSPMARNRLLLHILLMRSR